MTPQETQVAPRVRVASSVQHPPRPGQKRGAPGKQSGLSQPAHPLSYPLVVRSPTRPRGSRARAGWVWGCTVLGVKADTDLAPEVTRASPMFSTNTRTLDIPMTAAATVQRTKSLGSDFRGDVNITR